MAAKKRAKKKQTSAKKSKKNTGRKPAVKAVKKKVTARRKPAKKASRRKTAKAASARKKQPREKLQNTRPFFKERLRARPGRQSGDLQGLSRAEGSDSESVDELLEEGNTFEADVVLGVEDARDEEEVHTHEVPEDDVPGEYLDKD
ncbi:MAG: hypothetical protein LAP21_06680 [Acidobacteriia bacterium]|nr:hypothetical protein [Terriglobia bacterium]